jgi:hypothetical protein
MPEIAVLSRRAIDDTGAVCCLTELENVLVGDFDGELSCFPEVPNISGKTVFCATVNFVDLAPLEPALAELKQRGNRVIVYVFDCWSVAPLYSKRRKVRDQLKPRLRLDHIVDRLCLPFREAIGMLSPGHQALACHVPMAADTSLVNGLNELRPISVIGYGRQIPELSRALAERMNTPASRFFYHHTDHASLRRIEDQRLHRMHFWRMVQASQIALTYDPSWTNPWGVPLSIVSQRFYECLAAGCVLAGKRPRTAEADELLDWPDAIIDLPDDPALAVDALLDLHSDAARLKHMRERNVEEARSRHDWRHRVPLMLAAASPFACAA